MTQESLKNEQYYSLFILFPGKLNIDNLKELYQVLVKIFDKFILPTHGPFHVQYIMFYLLSFKLVCIVKSFGVFYHVSLGTCCMDIKKES